MKHIFQLNRRQFSLKEWAPRKGSGAQSRLPTALAVGISAVFLALSASAYAQQLILKDQVTDADGRITLGDVFENAGAAGDVLLGTRTGATAVLDAGQVQAVAARAGAIWDNPKGLRRIIVASGMDGMPSAPAMATASIVPGGGRNQQALVFTRPMNTGEVVQAEDLMYADVAAPAYGAPSDARAVIGKVVRYPLRQGAAVKSTDVSSPVVVHRSEAVSVTWSANGMALSMTGIAQKDAAAGDLIQIQNPASKKMIDAVVTGPGQAIAGQAASQLRSATLLSSR